MRVSNIITLFVFGLKARISLHKSFTKSRLIDKILGIVNESTLLILDSTELKYIAHYSNYCDVYIYKEDAKYHFDSATYDVSLYRTVGNRRAIAAP